FGHEQRVRQVEEGRHAAANQFLCSMPGSEGRQEDTNRLGIRRRKVCGQRAGDVPGPVEPLELVETAARVSDKYAIRERGMRQRQIRREALDEVFGEEGLEGLHGPSI